MRRPPREEGRGVHLRLDAVPAAAWARPRAQGWDIPLPGWCVAWLDTTEGNRERQNALLR